MAQKVDEYSRLMKILDFRLPHKFKRIGYVGAISIFVALLAGKFISDSTLLVKDVLRTLVLFFMLIASLSKDAFEDEFNRHIRFQSYVISFVCVGIYTIGLPLVTVVMDVLITNIRGEGIVNFHKISSFEVIFILMGLQLLFFETLKKLERAE